MVVKVVMGSVWTLLVVLMICSLLDTTLVRASCIKRDTKNTGYMYGVPVAVSCKKGEKSVCYDFIIPVDFQNNTQPKLDNTCKKDTIDNAGMYPKDGLKSSCMRLKDFLKKYKVPNFIKPVFIKCFDIDKKKDDCSKFEALNSCEEDETTTPSDCTTQPSCTTQPPTCTTKSKCTENPKKYDDLFLC